jgi:hypothetical protein
MNPSLRHLFPLVLTSLSLGSLHIGCGDDDATPPAADVDSGTTTNDAASGIDASTSIGDSGGTQDAKADATADADAAPATPDSPANAQTVTAGQTISGTVPPSGNGVDSMRWYKYVPAQAFTSVNVNVIAFTPATSNLSDIRWQAETMVGLCDLTGGTRCCLAEGGPACNLTIREGTPPTFTPVVAGKTYYIIVRGGDGASPTSSYSFSLVENP